MDCMGYTNQYSTFDVVVNRGLLFLNLEVLMIYFHPESDTITYPIADVKLSVKIVCWEQKAMENLTYGH